MVYTELHNLINDKKWDAVRQRLNTDQGRRETREKSNGGDLPLHSAAARQPPLDVVDKLIEIHPDGVREKSNNFGALPLHYAVWYRAPLDVVRILIEKYPGAVHERSGGDHSLLPIEWAERCGASEDVKRLLRDCAANQQQEQREAAERRRREEEEEAKRQEQTRQRLLLQQHQQRLLNENFRASVRTQDTDAMRKCIVNGADVSLPEVGGAALVDAAAAGSKEKLRILLDSGAPIANTTALHAATKEGHEAAVRFLLERGADPHDMDPATDLTPLEIAEPGSKVHELITKWLESPTQRWKRITDQPNFREVSAMNELLELTGLLAVKSEAIDLYNSVDIEKDRQRLRQQQGGASSTGRFSNSSLLSQMSLHMRFDGNPGTGKTTVGRLLGKALKQMNVLPSDTFVEVGGAELLRGGSDLLAKKLEEIEKGNGGILFLDEAYQLRPKADREGAAITNLLLKAMEDRREKLVVIVAGYKDDMDEFFSFNPGLPSRFPLQFTFEDYTWEELHDILKSQLESKQLRVSGSEWTEQFDKQTGKPCYHNSLTNKSVSERPEEMNNTRFLRIAARRLSRRRGMVGFGNGREVRNLVEDIYRRQSTRLANLKEDLRKNGESLQMHHITELTREDVLGRHKPLRDIEAKKELDNLVGLEKVKRSIDGLLRTAEENFDREDREEELVKLNLNRFFIGNPGTGKTQVAKLYGRILKEMGWLSRGDLEAKDAADFVGSVIGESEKKTAEILQACRGKVLLIDEAYNLGGDDIYRKAVVDTLVARVNPEPGDDVAGGALSCREILRPVIGQLA
ncbi:stage V sporulation protein K [Pseudoscourfieldia marina]